MASTPVCLHLMPEVVAFASPFAHAGEDRDTAELVLDGADQLLKQNRLADARRRRSAPPCRRGPGAPEGR